MLKLKGQPRWEASKTIFWGLVFTLAMFAFWYGLVGSPIDDYRIKISGKYAEAITAGCIQDYAESDSGQGGPFQDCQYSFVVNGQTYGGRDSFPNETDDGERFGIVYVNGHPEIHKKDFTVATGWFDFLFRKVFLSLTLLALFLISGIKLMIGGIKDFLKNEKPVDN